MRGAQALIALFFALLPAFALAAGDAASGVAGKPAAADGAQAMTQEQYRQGLEKLRGYLEKHGEDPSVAEQFIGDLANAFPEPSQRVPVTRDVFEIFLKSQAAWARKTRDSKNEGVSPPQLQHEIARSKQLRTQFRIEASRNSPRFYRAFRAAVRDVRRTPRADGKGYAGNSAVFFGDQVDDSYSHIDAGDEALEKGDAAGAIAEANLALAESPANADAFVLRSGAQYDSQNYAAAVKDAQRALQLDPGNQQALAIVSLSGMTSDAPQAAMANAVAGGSTLGNDERSSGLPTLGIPADGGLAPASPAAPARRRPPSATPAVGALLSKDMTSRAVKMAGVDARASIDQLDEALALNPRNASAQSWRATILNRIGDYSAALGSAEQGLTGNPDDGGAYFNKAYALAGTGDKKGMVEALTQAARLDASYRPLLDQALQLPSEEDMTLIFSGSATRHEPEITLPRRRRSHAALNLLGGLGGLLVLAGAVQIFRKSV